MSESRINRFEWLKAVLQAENLTPTAKNLASALAIQFANSETGQINPSQETLADYLKVHRDTVKRVMRELRNAGWLMATGDGGRGKAPHIRLLSPSRIIPFRAAKGGTIHPVHQQKRGGDLQPKGGEITPPHNKAEQSLEQRGAPISTHKPPSLALFKDHVFIGAATPGPRVLKISDHALTAWAEWLTQQCLPALYQMPIRQKPEKQRDVFFWVPTAKPPTSLEATREARWFFETLMDSEASTHAAQ